MLPRFKRPPPPAIPSPRPVIYYWPLKGDAMFLLWFILIVNVRPLSVCLWLTVQFIKDSLVVICWERAVPLAFHLCYFLFKCRLNCRCSFPLLVFRAGCGIRSYWFLIIAFICIFLSLHLSVTLWKPATESVTAGSCSLSPVDVIIMLKSNEKQQHKSQHMRFLYLSHRRPATAQASLRIRGISPEPSLFAHMKYGRRQMVRPNIRHLAPLDGSHARLKNKFTEDEKCHNLMRWLN